MAGYLYVRKALHLVSLSLFVLFRVANPFLIQTAEDYANQRRKTTVQLKLKPAHAAALKDITAKYHFKDQSKALRMAIDYANQEVDSDAIYTAQHISAVGEVRGNPCKAIQPMLVHSSPQRRPASSSTRSRTSSGSSR